MANDPTPKATAWGVLGIMASCFFGLFCLYHVVYWLWLAAAFGGDKNQAYSHLTTWVVLGACAAGVWCRLVWVIYFPKKKI